MASSSSAAAGVGVGHEHENVKPEGHRVTYNSGFGAEHATEALPGALPVGQNSPQKCPYGLYAEQLSGTAFTVPRAKNLRSWLYRIRPSVMHSKLSPMDHPHLLNTFTTSAHVDPNQMRWLPVPMPGDKPEDKCNWFEGLRTMMGAGEPTSRAGLAIYTYTCNTSMVDQALYNSDGDFLIVPQHGALHVQTELGFLDVAPKEILVIPRGIRFRVVVDGPSRGYVLEVFNGHFTLPDLGPIGANGLANPRDFLYPVAAFEDRETEYVLITKFGGKLWSALQLHSPFDVVAWHGNYAPCKYDLSKFNTMNTVSYDHPDPSIYTVLTVPTDTPGVALADFVIFPPRWMVAEGTFRPPYYHRNTMSEFMGMVWGAYDAKVGFQPGGASLHSPMTAHGPDSDTFLKASNGAGPQAPEKFTSGLAFMFETCLTLRLTDYALHAPHRDGEYQKCWSRLPRTFNPATRTITGDLVPMTLEAAVKAAQAAGSAAHVGEGAAAAAGGSAAGAGGAAAHGHGHHHNYLHAAASGSVLGDGTSAALSAAGGSAAGAGAGAGAGAASAGSKGGRTEAEDAAAASKRRRGE